MKIYLIEKIGNPDLFAGRKKELAFLQTWINKSQRRLSKSLAILSRRKTGKSALLQRLYNIIFEQNTDVIPFYFEIREGKQWLGNFAEDFFLTFVYQYLAFKTRQEGYLEQIETGSFEEITEIAEAENLHYLLRYIRRAKILKQAEESDALWHLTRDMPRGLASHTDETIIQMIDEFQYINRFICRDKACTSPINDLAASYLHTAEYKQAPLLVSGSWVGWLMSDLNAYLPDRFQKYFLKPLPEAEAVEVIYRYAALEDVPVSPDMVYLIAGLTEGNPFYISSLFRSYHLPQSFTTPESVLHTLEFETLHPSGDIRGTWLEYIDSAFPRINDRYAKEIVLYLSQNRDKLLSRQALQETLNLDMSDTDLRKKLKALLRSDIIEEHYARYRGVQDNIFDKIFRSEYGPDIDEFVPEGARNEYKALFEELLEKYNRLSGEHNRYKGAFAEFMIMQHLRHKAFQNSAFYQTLMQNLPLGFAFMAYDSVWAYHTPPLHEPAFQIDVFARATSPATSLIGEVKHRQTTKFSLNEAQTFVKHARVLIELEGIETYLLFVFSSAGFQQKALAYLQAEGVAWSEDERWLADI